MNDQEINLRIARFCGWQGPCSPYELVDAVMAQPPDYCNDLNAMHKAEKVLIREGLWQKYKNLIWQYFVSGRSFVEEATGHLYGDDLAHTPAKQRAIAFLKTKGELI